MNMLFSESLHENLLTINNVDTLLERVETLTSDVVDALRLESNILLFNHVNCSCRVE